ncbi:uncharacterized protein LOC133904463 [Phragmites australis]|uniref:uncharacterized protein LOC133904463 n=1 Tax=Phragmites australis TaxID=29695 RepID=UPI002D78D168|nr:uncharacterized protein LOC133904463 [Phragmites australis]
MRGPPVMRSQCQWLCRCRHWGGPSSVIWGKRRGQSAKEEAQPKQPATPRSAAAAAIMAQREKSATVAVAPGTAAAAAVPSSSSSSGAPAAGGERWSAAIGNLGELGANVESLQKLLARKAVFVDDDIFSKASLAADQARTIKVLDQRVQSLERELDAAISAAARARTEKRQAEAAQRVAELRAQEVTKELENTAKVFALHMEELRAKQEEIAKKDSDIKVLEAIIRTLSSKDDGGSSE